MTRVIYSALLYLLMPLVFARLAWRSLRNPEYRRNWPERLGFATLNIQRPSIWVHAVSVGEAQAAREMILQLKETHPSCDIVVTTTTPTGRERVRQIFGDDVIGCYVPYDIPWAVKRFLDASRPRVAIIMETELWPNIIATCHRRNIPVVVANARLSERSAAGYAWLGAFVAAMLQQITVIAAQAQDDAERFVALGAPPARVHHTGSVKFDMHWPASLIEQAQALRRTLGVERGVWIVASTHEAEETQLLDAYANVLCAIPDCLLLFVPRHPERFAPAAALCRKRGFRTVLRSGTPLSCEDADVYVGDTMGELGLFYAACDVAFVGGSLADVGGHNMLEPAAFGVPVLFGPHVHNFADIAQQLRSVGAARQVVDARQLADEVVALLRDANRRRHMGDAAMVFVEQNRGALSRLLGLVEPLLADETH